MSMDNAIGILETRGMTAAVAAMDAMAKAAEIEVLRLDKTGSNYVTVLIRGEVAQVKAAIDSGAETAAKHGELVSVHVIASPHSTTNKTLQINRGQP